MSVARPADIRSTYGDYLLLPEAPRYELIDGALRMTPATPRHQEVSLRLEPHFVGGLSHLGKVYHAPIDVVLSDENVVQPDIVFIARSRLRIIGKACIRGAPDLIVEILSPKTAARDRVVKRKLYASCGVREYWIVDPDEETIEILVLSPHGFKCVRVWRPPARLVSPTYPRLRIPLGPIFA